MAPRSYLSRIAQPLVAGDPVVWSVPRPAAEEARPAATTTSAEPTIRRSAPLSPPAGPVAKPAPSDAIRSEARAPIRAPSERRASRAQPTLVEQATAPPSMDIRSPTPIDELSAAELAIPDAVSTAPISRQAIDPSASPRTERHASAAAHDVAAAAPTVETLSAQSLPAKPAPHSNPSPEPQWPTREEALPAPRTEPAAHPPTVNTAAPRLHIGAIEIRATAPPPAPAPTPAPIMAAATPSAPGGRIGRAYAWRFGLVQG